MTLYETIRRLVREEVGQVRTAELGVVQAQHPHASDSDTDNYACTVELRDSGIVLKQVPVATQRIGSVSIPAVGELVLVQFVGGDLNAPVITGRLYNEEDRPPSSDDGQWILHLPLGAGDSDAVHVELHSTDKRELLLKLGSALTLTLKDDDPVVEIDVDGGKAALAIARDGGVTITSQGSLKVEASTDVALKGANVKVEASGELTLKGAVVNIN
ncbi:MAG: Rhs element Vgr protein [Deltaproteobacteria bacterium]|nr:Rhs element Vgr protein [Deltaproteobacteria bacterium]